MIRPLSLLRQPTIAGNIIYQLSSELYDKKAADIDKPAYDRITEI